MPEEINRIIADRMSTILFCPTKSSYQNIENEIPRLNATPPFSLEQPGAILCGDIMFDHALHYAEQALENRDLLLKLGIEEREFILCTVHRQQNTDNPERLKEIFEALMRLSEESGLLILIPMHPRTSAALKTPSHSRLAEKIRISGKIKIIPPVSYLEMLLLEQMSEIIVTDSGGVQKEAYFFKKPSVILRSETEWTEIAETGSAILAGNGADGLANAYNNLQGKRAELVYPPLFGDGDAAAIICQTLIQCFNTLKS